MKTLSKDANELIISLLTQQMAGKITSKDADLLAKLMAKKLGAETPETPARKASAPKASARKASAPKASARKASAPKASAPKASAPKASARKASAPKSKAAAVKAMQIVESYTEKSFAIIGETKPLKSALKELHGRFNPWLNINGEKTAGWIFSNKCRDAVRESLGI